MLLLGAAAQMVELSSMKHKDSQGYYKQLAMVPFDNGHATEPSEARDTSVGVSKPFGAE